MPDEPVDVYRVIEVFIDRHGTWKGRLWMVVLCAAEKKYGFSGVFEATNPVTCRN